MSRNQFLSLSGAQLRDLAATGDVAALAEIERRKAKRVAEGKVTVAAARSWGHANAVEAAKAMNVTVAGLVTPKIPVPEVTEVFVSAQAPAKREPLTKGGLTLLSVDKRLRTVEADVSAIKGILAKYAH
jgi:hypothetical protein